MASTRFWHRRMMPPSANTNGAKRSQAARMRWASESSGLSCSVGLRRAFELTGIVWVAVVTLNGAQSRCIQYGILTMALCHSLMRTYAKPGDVLCLVSGCTSRVQHGISSSKGDRLILLMAVFHEIIPQFLYRGLAERRILWRGDRIYLVRCCDFYHRN